MLAGKMVSGQLAVVLTRCMLGAFFRAAKARNPKVVCRLGH
jgi:hypothetical protein